MRIAVGIDLGSTTTKAVVLDDHGALLGRGITNSRSNYEVACGVALTEALINARFGLVRAELARRGVSGVAATALLAELERGFRAEQYLHQLQHLRRLMLARLAGESETALTAAVTGILDAMRGETRTLFAAEARRKSDFFRDLAGSRYLSLAEAESARGLVRFDRMASLFDKTILEVENLPADDDAFRTHADAALRAVPHEGDALRAAIAAAAATPFLRAGTVGTGYGRQTLPFPKQQIRSEILCHGLGAHAMFPHTRTVLDIGGQDTKAIQVDANGIVTSFQMNDRCAAGCGRYLGYIADEMSLGVHELGPLACASTRPARINSTCTVFAGAELRERLSLGEKREDIVAGLHRAIILRAMSLLARSGGVSDQFTFTGGVANNTAAVAALGELLRENYGELTMNISPDSIYTGALGAALFAHRDTTAQEGDAA